MPWLADMTWMWKLLWTCGECARMECDMMCMGMGSVEIILKYCSVWSMVQFGDLAIC